MGYIDKPERDDISPEVAREDERRRAMRHTVLIGVKLRRPGETWFTSRISDLTEHGFRLHSFVNLSVGMTVWVMFAGFEGRRANVIWAEGHEAGCVFETPLHSAIYDHIMRVSP
jgi:hypothetical protein